MALIKANAASSAMENSLKGRLNTQSKGNRTSARSASGQQIARSKNHRNTVTNIFISKVPLGLIYTKDEIIPGRRPCAQQFQASSKSSWWLTAHVITRIRTQEGASPPMIRNGARPMTSSQFP